VKRLTEADVIARFDEKGNSPRIWRKRADELLGASKALLGLWQEAILVDPPHPPEVLGHYNPAIMLRAMAFECLLKARALD
jgi:hypothetical protein